MAKSTPSTPPLSAPVVDVDMTALAVDHTALTIADAVAVLHQPLTPTTAGVLVFRAVGDRLDHIPITYLRDVHDAVMRKIVTPTDELLETVRNWRPDIGQITVGMYRRFVADLNRQHVFPASAYEMLRAAYGEQVDGLPFALAQPLLKRIFDELAAEKKASTEPSTSA